MISFGTDGWRAVMADTFTFSNLRLVAQAVADAINDDYTGEGGPEVIIGYDTRFLSDRFATEVARVMAGNGIIAWLSRADVPTPAVSYTVKAKGAQAGIVITASHNPPRYNGFKLKAAYGGSATAEQSRRVEQELRQMELDVRGPNIIDYKKGVQLDLIRSFDPAWIYYQHLSELVDLDRISQSELKVIADSMYGAGRGSFSAILSRTRTTVTEIRGEMNPGFGGIHPEPILPFINELIAAVKREHFDIGLATDGDADRIGAVDALGNFVDPHQIFALVLNHLIQNKSMTGDVVKTVSTTFMIDEMAKKYNLKVHETPVGFNHIADLMMQHDVLIGGEESGGISIKGHIPEGDGILMGLLLLEVMAYAKAPLHEIIQQLQAEFGPAHYGRNDVRLQRSLNKTELVKQLAENAPDTLNGEKITSISTKDGIKYYMADASWLLIRPSGTEPVLRIYAEARSPEAVEALLLQGGKLGQDLLS
ncbi:phosphoglucomutase/phosphomannomutase family protein [Anaerolineales bacterium]